jgi:hypothetical protein
MRFAEAGSIHELVLDQLDQDQAQDLVTIRSRASRASPTTW